MALLKVCLKVVLLSRPNEQHRAHISLFCGVGSNRRYNPGSNIDSRCGYVRDLEDVVGHKLDRAHQLWVSRVSFTDDPRVSVVNAS